MRKLTATAVLAGALTLGITTGCAQAQDFLPVGSDAPDVEFVVASQEGVQGTQSLSAFRGETVVLAFFFKQRTPG